jgi:hypothetical protein
MSKMSTGLSVVVLLAATAVAAAEMRTWTFEESGKTLEGEVVGFAGDAVTLRRADGRTNFVPIAYFMISDRVYLAAERAKQWKEVEVVKLEDAASSGRYKKCSVRGKDVNGEVFIERLPSSVEVVLKNRSQQDAQITNLTAQIAIQNRAVQQAKAAIPAGASGNRAYRRAVAAERAQVDRASKDLKNAQANLAKLQKSYDDSVKKTKDQTTVKMRNTGVVYKALPVWECNDSRKPLE